MNFQLPEKQTPPRVLNRTRQALTSDFNIDTLEKIGGGGEGKKKYPARQCKVCAAHKKRSELDTFVNSALFRFTKGLF